MHELIIVVAVWAHFRAAQFTEANAEETAIFEGIVGENAWLESYD